MRCWLGAINDDKDVHYKGVLSLIVDIENMDVPVVKNLHFQVFC